MKKLTDEKVAKALGWKRVRGLSASENDYFHWRCEETGSNSAKLPAFTTSLDAIVAEIEARGLLFYVNTFNAECEASVGHPDKYGNKYDSKHAWGKTPPVALCAAMLAYIKGEQ